VSEDDRIPGYGPRKAALRRQVAAAGPEALMIFAADKVSKVRELRTAISLADRRHEQLEPGAIRPRRVAHLKRCLGMLQEQLSGSPLVEQLRDELVRLDCDLRNHAKVKAAA
jgi:hypothetical protein